MTLAKIPAGARQPNKARETGAVAAKAATEADKGDATAGGTNGAKTRLTKGAIKSKPDMAEYDSMKAGLVRSAGLSRAWIRNTAGSAILPSAPETCRPEQEARSRAKSSALSRDGESPAKKTKEHRTRASKKKFFRLPSRPARKDRCIPLSARTWDSPALRKDSTRGKSRYSLEPESRARTNEPALPHEKSSLLKFSLATARI